MSARDYTVIDGSYGEGGGQILRTSLSLAAMEVDEMAVFCARYEEVQDQPHIEMIFDLMDYLPESDQIVPIPELIEECHHR